MLKADNIKEFHFYPICNNTSLIKTRAFSHKQVTSSLQAGKIFQECMVNMSRKKGLEI